MSDDNDTRILLRRLLGELSPDEGRRLDARLAAEPELRASAERLERDWRGLELPDTAAPAGFAGDVMARLEPAEPEAPEPEAPAWARLAAAAALLAGIGLGIGLGPVPLPGGPGEELSAPSVETLADGYLAALEELEREVVE